LLLTLIFVKYTLKLNTPPSINLRLTIWKELVGLIKGRIEKSVFLSLRFNPFVKANGNS